MAMNCILGTRSPRSAFLVCNCLKEWKIKLYFKHELKCFIAISNNEKTIETRGPPGPSVLLFSSCLSSQ